MKEIINELNKLNLLQKSIDFVEDLPEEIFFMNNWAEVYRQKGIDLTYARSFFKKKENKYRVLVMVTDNLNDCIKKLKKIDYKPNKKIANRLFLFYIDGEIISYDGLRKSLIRRYNNI